MSANLLSAARTGAGPGVAAKHLANKDSRTVSIIGCGPINKACFTAIMTQLPAVEKVVCFDVFLDKANELASWVAETYKVEAVGVDEAESRLPRHRRGHRRRLASEAALLQGRVDQEGPTILVSGPFSTDESFLTGAKVVYDHTALQEAYVEDAIASGKKDAYYGGVIGGPFFRLIVDAGKLPALTDYTGLGDVVNGRKPGRQNARKRVIFIACGMAVFDIS